jgi:hypothetical protein
MSSVESEPRYRFTSDFQFFDYDGSRLWRSWHAGTVITDAKEIQWLIARTAPVERIHTHKEPPCQKQI